MEIDSRKIDVDKVLKDIADPTSISFPLFKAADLLRYILKNGSMTDFRRLFDCVKSTADIRHSWYGKDVNISNDLFFIDPDFDVLYLLTREQYMTMLEDGWLSRLELPHLLWFYNDLRHRCERGCITFLCQILEDRRIAAEKRAMLCHAVFTTNTPFIREFDHLLVQQFLWYNTRRAEVIGRLRNCFDYALYKRFNLSPRINFHAPFKVLKMIEDDKCSLFELNRQLEGCRICDSMLQFLIESNAARCFTCLLSHYPTQVFGFRYPEEWLFTVCRCAGEKLATAAVVEIERQFPGIVTSARDPWGNTLLWNTFVNENPTEGLREELIRLGCDPNAENEWGVSYQLLKDNDPDKLLKHDGDARHAV